MSLWQETLFIISAIALCISTGLIGICLALRKKPKQSSQNREKFVSKNIPAIISSSSQDFQNIGHGDILTHAAQAVCEENNFDFKKKNKHIHDEREANLKIKHLSQLERQVETINRKETTLDLVEPEKKNKISIEFFRETNKLLTQDGNSPTLIQTEIQTNLKIATTPWSGKPLFFQTELWDSNNAQFDTIPKELHNDLKEAYVDMHVANQIVWLFSTIGSISNDLESSYRLLCIKITERLAPLLK